MPWASGNVGRAGFRTGSYRSPLRKRDFSAYLAWIRTLLRVGLLCPSGIFQSSPLLPLTDHSGAAQPLPTKASPSFQGVLFCSFKRCASQSIHISQRLLPLSLNFALKQETTSLFWAPRPIGWAPASPCTSPPPTSLDPSSLPTQGLQHQSPSLAKLRPHVPPYDGGCGDRDSAVSQGLGLCVLRAGTDAKEQ